MTLSHMTLPSFEPQLGLDPYFQTLQPRMKSPIQNSLFGMIRASQPATPFKFDVFEDEYWVGYVGASSSIDPKTRSLP